MPTTKIHWGQIFVVFSSVLLSLWVATQWTAWRLGFQSELGQPSFAAPGVFPVYFPLIFFWWWYAFDAYAPDIFLEGGAIAASGAFFSIIAAIAISVWRAREEREAATYGSARRATAGEIKSAGLTSANGVVLGKFARDYLRHDGPEHVLCFAPTLSGKGIGLVVPSLLASPGIAATFKVASYDRCYQNSPWSNRLHKPSSINLESGSRFIPAAAASSNRSCEKSSP